MNPTKHHDRDRARSDRGEPSPPRTDAPLRAPLLWPWPEPEELGREVFSPKIGAGLEDGLCSLRSIGVCVRDAGRGHARERREVTSPHSRPVPRSVSACRRLEECER